ncbi:hypothetical protein FOCC_FOCC007726, partial [Frankliniella occidentalis]
MANVTQAEPAAQACSVQRGSTSSGADELEQSGSGLGYQAIQLLIGLATPGRLKTVKVLLATALDRTEATILFLAILRTPGLEEITIKGRNIRQPMLKPSPVYEGLSSSLRTFCLNVEGVGEWAQLVLSMHGETLKKVVLATALVETEATAAPCNLTLQSLRSVQELTVQLDPRLQTLAEPTSLQVLYLLVDGREAEEHFAAAGELFLRAANLREVAMLALPEKRLDVRAVLPGHCSLLVRGLVRARAQSLVTKLSLVPKISWEDSAELLQLPQHPWLLARTLRQ